MVQFKIVRTKLFQYVSIELEIYIYYIYINTNKIENIYLYNLSFEHVIMYALQRYEWLQVYSNRYHAPPLQVTCFYIPVSRSLKLVLRLEI